MTVARNETFKYDQVSRYINELIEKGDLKPGDKVLSNAFTLAPVPGAIAAVGAQPVFVGVTEALTIDLDDLQ